MIYLFYSDLHLRPERLDTCEIALNEIFKIVQNYDPAKITIVNGGDTFNTRGLIRTNCFDTLYRHYSNWFESGYSQIILVGNHDQEDKAGEIHPMRVFKSWSGWQVVDEPMVLRDMAFFPYMEHHKIEAAIKKIVKGRKEPMDAVVHWGIKGAKRNDSNVDNDGVPLEWLSPFRNVFSGHYHYRNKIGNVQYIGSPFQQNYGEMGQNKGVIIYDSNKNKTEFVEIDNTPKHYEIEVHWHGDKQVSIAKEIGVITENDYCRVKATGDAEQCSNLDDLGIKAKEVKVERIVKEKHFSRLNIDQSEVLSPSKLMKKYVDYVEIDLDKKRLMDIGSEFL
jgi:DNA repair exonuclease SbcCD nuclease subunit